MENPNIEIRNKFEMKKIQKIQIWSAWTLTLPLGGTQSTASETPKPERSS